MKETIENAKQIRDLLWPGVTTHRARYGNRIRADLACEEPGDVYLVLSKGDSEARVRIATAGHDDSWKSIFSVKVDTAFSVFDQICGELPDVVA